MYALFLILNDIYKLDDIKEIFYEAGVGATTFDSRGMGKVLLEHNVDVPIVAGLRRLIEGDKPYNKTIISVIREEDKLKKVIDRINEELDYFNEPGVGFMFVLPVLECYGSKVDNKKNS
ncbi:P-II family nitrogen regulator [Caldisalinibacter kiritimatiensis]|uniref:Nitrogen regulatory protein P-II n=1 Tax=Caldisalinibacter kiritimatiensis TaxID=1304284 RepID=R1AUA0_9FIRM|nr:P-II family nitrogen regulator [Caldisalinibacter kiritimatiensis]EOD00242.1 hypothetical protein L21TH_1716 [Caldisalinibacter kiritimatiensis]